MSFAGVLLSLAVQGVLLYVAVRRSPLPIVSPAMFGVSLILFYHASVYSTRHLHVPSARADVAPRAYRRDIYAILPGGVAWSMGDGACSRRILPSTLWYVVKYWDDCSEWLFGVARYRRRPR